MTVHMLTPLKGTIDQSVVPIQGSFAPDTASPVTSVLGRGFSVAHTSTGLFTITLDQVYQALLAANCSIQLATGDDKMVQFGAIDMAARTIQIRVWDISAAAVADVAANANNRIHFQLMVRDSTVA